MTPAEALARLAGREGPPRFARVAEGIFRGGQPTRAQLEALQALGVRSLINLRREARSLRRAEAAHAVELGLRFVHFPFYGVFGADERFLDAILEEMRRGGVYIHCKYGRDRTSLVIALYRVRFEGWDREDAWQREVLHYQHSPSYFYRRLRTSFDRYLGRRQGTVGATR